MKYKSGAAFRQALEQRLLARWRETGTSLVRLRKAVVFDRLLARLVSMSFVVRVRSPSRKSSARAPLSTQRCGAATTATADLMAAQSVELDDFFNFHIEKVGPPGGDLDGAAMRYRVRAELGGRRFEDVIVDIAFSDPLKWEPEKIAGTDLLEFAGIERIEVPVLPLEQHVAEKVHAYTRAYSSGRASSRAKDLVDIVLVKQLMVLDAARLHAALIGVFERWRQHPLPDRLPLPPARLGGVLPQAQQSGRHQSRTTNCAYRSRGTPRSYFGRRCSGPVGPEGSSLAVIPLGEIGSRTRKITVPKIVPCCAQNCALPAYLC